IMVAMSPSQKEPVAAAITAQANAPTINNDPCGKLITPMTPKIRIMTAAIKNSITPNCNLLINYSNKSAEDKTASDLLIGYHKNIFEKSHLCRPKTCYGNSPAGTEDSLSEKQRQFTLSLHPVASELAVFCIVVLMIGKACCHDLIGQD